MRVDGPDIEHVLVLGVRLDGGHLLPLRAHVGVEVLLLAGGIAVADEDDVDLGVGRPRLHDRHDIAVVLDRGPLLRRERGGGGYMRVAGVTIGTGEVFDFDVIRGMGRVLAVRSSGWRAVAPALGRGRGDRSRAGESRRQGDSAGHGQTLAGYAGRMSAHGRSPKRQRAPGDTKSAT